MERIIKTGEFLEAEHKFHDKVTEHCPTCFKEQRLIKARNTVNRRDYDSESRLERLDDYLLYNKDHN